MTEDKGLKTIEQGLMLAVSNEVKEVTDKIIDKAKADLDREIRAIVGKLALTVSDYFSVERLGRDVRITVLHHKERWGMTEDKEISYEKILEIIAEEREKWVDSDSLYPPEKSPSNKFAIGVKAGIEAIEYRVRKHENRRQRKHYSIWVWEVSRQPYC
jgi:hypothetical protein